MRVSLTQGTRGGYVHEIFPTKFYCSLVDIVCERSFGMTEDRHDDLLSQAVNRNQSLDDGLDHISVSKMKTLNTN